MAFFASIAVQEVANRKAELRGTKSIDPYPFLYADDEIDGPDAHYFVHRGNVGDGPSRRVFEAYKWDHGYRFKLGIEGSDFLHPDQTKDPIVQHIKIKNDVPKKTQLIFDLVKRLRWRSEDEIPREPGLCFFGAFLPGKATDKEDVQAQFAFPNNRDVSFDFESNSGIREPNTLMQRGDQINAGLSSMKGGRTVRKGAVTLQGIDAEEWLIAGETDLEVPGSMFTLEANSMTSGAQSPLLTLDFYTGSPNAFVQGRIKAASMSEGEAVALWDVISRSLRPRPNGF
ncbi:T6SS immunity protein Tli4 family protein [Paraburkholderia sp. CNPSo 3281]|uniref:T6SS immunity protein Tli4 family protein n=1 Tax=Paraburkholderia sp. CNPSo 3281 TaxID=2940933 RepID=UPI0020B7BB6C|nr:T6SS immunity protein Tli4 family protein [Paraburkholderia sp. CNPSo 3281]MCP3721410.1 T6SS immunity protein Tli4 family protein [Paraburkholderia sp. CNPSo 3281]